MDRGSAQTTTQPMKLSDLPDIKLTGGLRWPQSKRQMSKQWTGRVIPNQDTSSLPSSRSSSHWTCLISCGTLSCSPTSTPRFLDRLPNSTQSAARCAPRRPLCQPPVISTCLPKITPCLLSLSPSSTTIIPTASKNQNWRVKLSQL